jgi:hypothetical protein
MCEVNKESKRNEKIIILLFSITTDGLMCVMERMIVLTFPMKPIAQVSEIHKNET